MARYVCPVCGYVHDNSIEGVDWDSLSDDWSCPVCGAAKVQFQREGAAQSPAEAFDRPAAAPARRAIAAHRVFGYVFLAIYVLLMFQMVPRLWSYQIEFPARTVVHISLGMAIGAALVLKIAVVRFFRRLEPSLVPPLGTTLLVGSVVLIGISVPSAFREAVATKRLFSPENQQRLREQLALTGLDEAGCQRWAEPNSLRAGRRVLRQDCITCHDLRTVLAKPRTPQNWRQTVSRMAERTTKWTPLEEDEQWQVTAYLIALSPQLQRSTQQLRDEQERRDQSKLTAETIAEEKVTTSTYDAATAQQLFESKCSQCHQANLVGTAPPGSEEEVRQLVARMVDEGLEATREELSQIMRYLTETHVKTSQ